MRTTKTKTEAIEAIEGLQGGGRKRKRGGIGTLIAAIYKRLVVEVNEASQPSADGENIHLDVDLNNRRQ
jgi:hypothetical protein